MRLLAVLGLVFSLGCPSGVSAQISDRLVKIGILNDMDGPYADLSGKGSVVVAQMAIDEMKPSLSFEVELVSAGHHSSRTSAPESYGVGSTPMASTWLIAWSIPCISSK